MHIELFSIGSLSIKTYGFMMAVGVLSAVALCIYRGRKRGISEDLIMNIVLICLFAGLVGAKVFHYVGNLPAIIKDPSLLLNIGSGFVVYGGIIFGILAGFLYCRKKKEPFLQMADFIIPAVPLAQGFGRLGCFFAGCCYGIETDAWYGVHFPTMAEGVRVIPTQLLSSAGDFLIAAILLLLSRRKRFDGQILVGYMLLYGVGRFFIEYLRNDPRGSVGIFSTSQFISLFVVSFGVAAFVFLRKKKRTPTPLSLHETERSE
ncbi:prolipoprotein diacylglyceryl transferase [Christensenellaceae bacterium OttesenSCG-928-L17]|nr:prolipoprotein diacylglyceryl transferase [Christensenellaceae bacterium OttesenSCG-928-L17]